MNPGPVTFPGIAMLQNLRETISYFFFKRRLLKKMTSLYAMEDPWRSRLLSGLFEPFFAEALGSRSANAKELPVLDAGGGEGLLHQALGAPELYHLLDIAPSALKRAEKNLRASGFRFIAASLDDFRPGARRYGAILFGSVLTYLGREKHPLLYRKTLMRLADSLAPGGVILLVHPFYNTREKAGLESLGAPILENPRFERVLRRELAGKPQSFLCEAYKRTAE